MVAAIAALESPTAQPSIDFALIGHLDGWDRASSLLNAFARNEPFDREEIADLLPWIPPRPLFHITARSIRGCEVRGVYIDCFISPDELGASFTQRNVQRVRAAAAAAASEGARVATLGGFSSILLEGDVDALRCFAPTAFTTGNTLTAAYILTAVERALRERGTALQSQRVLVIGSTGDIGSACVASLTGHVRELLLTARSASRLRTQLLALGDTRARASIDLEEFLPVADVIISVASTAGKGLDLINARPDAIICDAGYPPNVFRFPRGCEMAFHGGMGEILAGYAVDPSAADVWRRNATHAIVHGCLLEAMLLALENRFESFSAGRGSITQGRIDEIDAIALRHGFSAAPPSQTRIDCEAGEA